MPEVFISYRQIDEAQSKRVRSFADTLREYGINVEFDQYYQEAHPEGPPEGWPKWSSDRAERAQRILVVGSKPWFGCFDGSQQPGTGLGAACEAGVIRQRLYDGANKNENIRLVFFDKADTENIPIDIKRYHYFFANYNIPQIVRWLYSSSNSERFCAEEVELRRHAHATSEFSQHDTSDLSLLFLSVKDCNESRRIVRKFVRSLRKEEACSLHGMYDLLGRWDLHVRLRCPKARFDEHEEKLHKELLREGQMDENDPDFGGYEYINVLTEARSFRELLEASPNSRELKRRILGDTLIYEQRRCQRGFLYIRLPKATSEETLRDQQTVIQVLSTTLDDDFKFQAIVEGIYKGSNELVIETFMSCAQSQEMNALNRKIETVLTRYELQKYTMFSYGYDEAEVIPK